MPVTQLVIGLSETVALNANFESMMRLHADDIAHRCAD